MRTIFAFLLALLAGSAGQQMSEAQPNPQLMPPSGVLQINTEAEQIAPFKINADTSGCYYLKMIGTSNGQAVLTVFLRAGESVLIDVPLGEFEIHYATGHTWFGEIHHFGQAARCFKLDTNLRFFVDGETIAGHELTLYGVSDGNIVSEPIAPEKF